MLIITALFFFTILEVAYSGTEATTAPHPKIVKCGVEWINIHKGNPNLTGVYIQQKPDSRIDADDYEGAHPAMIIFVFQDGWKHTVTYTPSGQVQNGVWSRIEKDDWVYGVMSTELKKELECAYWVTE